MSNPDDYLPHSPPEWDEELDPDDDPPPAEDTSNPPTEENGFENDITLLPPITRKKRAPILITSLSCSDDIPLCEHVIFGKYFKMLRSSGLPRDMIELKVFQDGLNPAVLDLDESSALPMGFPVYAPTPVLNHNTSNNLLFASVDEEEGNVLSRKGKRAVPAPPSTSPSSRRSPPHLLHHHRSKPPAPPAAVEEADDANNGQVELVPANEHPTYSRYFRMVKVGLPRVNVEQKMIGDNLDPDFFFNLQPTDAINKHFVQRLSTSQQAAKVTKIELKNVKTANEGLKSRKKRVFVTAIDHSHVGEDSLWNDDHADNANIELDEHEFNRLFVDDQNSTSSNPQKPPQPLTSKKRGLKTIISSKRAQNGAIALSRIKMSPPQIVELISQLSAEALTSEQLKALLEFLPTSDESKVVESYRGDKSELGVVEQYMLATFNLPNIKLYIDTILFKQSFLSRWHDVKHRLGLLESACDQIKQSRGLKIVLRTALKVVNQLNRQEDSSSSIAGMTVESLLKLSTTKGFDRKTSVLQYVIIVIDRHNSEDHPLQFANDLPLLPEAAKMTLDSISSERQAIESELSSLIASLKQQVKETNGETDSPLAKAARDFEHKLLPLCNDLDKRQQQLQGKYTNILAYFGERPSLLWSEFFQPLHKFVVEFAMTWQQVEKAHQAEKRKAHAVQRLALQQQQQQTKALAAAAGTGGGRRSSVTAGEGRRASVTKKPVAVTQANNDSK